MTSFQFFVMFQSVIALTFAELFYKVSFGMPEKWDLGTETWDPYLGPSNQDPATRMNKQDPKPGTWDLGPGTWDPRPIGGTQDPRTLPRTWKPGLIGRNPGPISRAWDLGALPETIYLGPCIWELIHQPNVWDQHKTNHFFYQSMLLFYCFILNLSFGD